MEDEAVKELLRTKKLPFKNEGDRKLFETRGIQFTSTNEYILPPDFQIIQYDYPHHRWFNFINDKDQIILVCFYKKTPYETKFIINPM